MVLAPNKTKIMNWVQGWNDNCPYFSNSLFGVCQGVWRTRQQISASRPVQEARADSYGGRNLSTGGKNDAPPSGLPPAVGRVAT